MHRSWTFAFLRAVSNGVLRDLNMALVTRQMLRGARSIYVDFVDYDAVAHHAGILQPELPVDGLAKGSPGRPAAEAKRGDQSRSEKSDSLHVICSFDGRRLCVWSAGRMLS